MELVKWGIIGCGNVCEVKSGPGFQKADGSELVAVMRRNGDKAKDFATRHGVPKWYNNADALINDPEVTAIYIATPPGSHLEYTLKAATAGKPVYVEKPMARTFEECQQMIAACATAKVPLFVAYYRRSLPYFLKVKELLDSEVIGELGSANILFFNSQKADDTKPEIFWRINPEISGGGHFHDLASHQFDLLTFLFGDIKKASGMSNRQLIQNGGEDIVSASFEFESGLVGSGLWNFTVPKNQTKDEVLIQGSHGSISFSCFNGDAPIVLATESGKEEFSLPYPPHVQQPLIQTIVDELSGRGTCPSNGISGAHANWVMDAILIGT